ncbi:MAG: hypothetical protein H7239_07230 [Flavobacterium sp.]|nr:hypothetical protein [Flavobacterium sp.]
MKSTILLLFVILASCSKDSSKGFNAQLPSETQVGANTFGVTINGKVYLPRDPIGTNVGGSNGHGMRLWGGGIAPNEYVEIVVVDGASSVGFKMTIHIQNTSTLGIYQLKQSNFQNQADSILENHIFFKIYDYNLGNYAYYGSIENQAILKISRRDNGIISGNFSGKFVRYDNPNEFITITDGRFDINSFTLESQPFP